MTSARERSLLAVAIVLEVVAIWFVHWIDTRGYMDAEIYRLGARAWLRGNEIYGGDLTPETPDSGTLPFIYPPFAAILFTPLTWLSTEGAVVVVSVLSHLAILATAYALARSSRYFAPRAGQVALATALLLPWFTVLEPARDTINYGQINLLLMGLVALDCLLPRTPWPRGLLVGLAGAIKLTPLGFLLLFLLRRDLRAMAVTGLTFLATVLIGVLAAPRDSAVWWLEEMVATGDEHGLVYAGNQTLRSLLAKQELTDAALNVPWLLGCALLLVVAVLAMRYALRTANVPLALMFNAVLVLLVSPISWSHHWVWAAPALALVGAMAVRHRWYGVQLTVGLCALAVAIGPHWYLPYTNDRELDWTFSQQVVGNSYVLIGIGFLIAGAIGHLRFTRYRPAAATEAPTYGRA
ncbi:glycosyltransferase 87 family protein [Saccharopolyspora cebuensis]|uniref:Glycosyltransferase 87 family protein n=1 Tax=Saccharopolyspora cebuensis TaxID=418759 RepID=A0ABV4CEF7_9PSEU